MPETENVTEAAQSAAPGQVIAPAGSPVPAEQPAPISSEDQSPEQAPLPSMPEQSTPDATDGAISWTATEFVGHQKTAGWYGLLALAAALLAALIYLLTRDFISATVVIIGAAIFGYYAARQPSNVAYQIDGGGITIGNKYHSFDEFRSFAVVQEGGHNGIVFAPLKRFAPLTTIYYNQPDEDAIVNLLAERLPMEEHRHDAIDRLMNRIRF